MRQNRIPFKCDRGDFIPESYHDVREEEKEEEEIIIIIMNQTDELLLNEEDRFDGN